MDRHETTVHQRSKIKNQGGRSKSRKRWNECSVNDVNLQILLSKRLKLGMHDYSCCSAKEHTRNINILLINDFLHFHSLVRSLAISLFLSFIHPLSLLLTAALARGGLTQTPQKSCYDMRSMTPVRVRERPYISGREEYCLWMRHNLIPIRPTGSIATSIHASQMI